MFVVWWLEMLLFRYLILWWLFEIQLLFVDILNEDIE